MCIRDSLSRIEKPSPMPIGISNSAINNDVFDNEAGSGAPSYAMQNK